MIKPYKIIGKCKLWLRSRTGYGYGRKQKDKKTQYVHRLEWEKYYGKIPDGMCVLHKCDNPPCYNINHLFLGTKKDNMIDKTMKGRGYNPNQKLTIQEVKEIKERLACGERNCDIAKIYNVTRGNISCIKIGFSWVKV